MAGPNSTFPLAGRYRYSPHRTVQKGPITIQIPTPDFKPHRWQLEVLADGHRFQVLNWHRKSRKTTLGINKLILGAASTHNRTYWYIAPTYTLAKSTVVTDPNMLKRYLPREILSKPFNESELTATFKTGSILSVKGADDPDRLRGPNPYGVVLDEFAKMKPETYTEIIRPVLAQNNGWCMILGTPKGKNHFWNFCQRGKDKVNFPEWRTFELKASFSGLISQVELDKARKEMLEDLYQQEMETAFLDYAGSVFKGLQSCIAGGFEDPVRGEQYVIGADFGRHHDASVFTCGRISTKHVVAWERLTETDYALQKKILAAMSRKYNNAVIHCDSTGFSAGDAIEEDLREMGLSVEGFQFSPKSKKALIDGLRVAISQRLITLPHIQQVIDEMEYFETILDSRGNYRGYGAPEGEGHFDDCLKRGTLIKTRFGYKPIEAIKIGDPVYTHLGRLKKVTNIIKKPFSGDFYQVKPQASLKLELSYNHPLYCVHRQKTGKASPFYKYIGRKWVLPGELKGSHRAVILIPKYGTGNRKLQEAMFYKNSKMANRILLKELSMDSEFAYFLGLFLAEGHCAKHGYTMELAFSDKENDRGDFISNYLKRLGIKSRKESYFGDAKGFKLLFSSKLLWHILRVCYDKNKEKIVPPYAFGLGNDLQLVLNGWLDGDGWRDKKRNIPCVIGATTSKALALDMRDIALFCGKYATINTCKRNRYGKPSKDQFWVYVNDSKPFFSRMRKVSDFEYASKLKVKLEHFSGEVYNLEVEGDQSFIADGIVVHNCVISLGLMVFGFKGRLYSADPDPVAYDLAYDRMKKNYGFSWTK